MRIVMIAFSNLEYTIELTEALSKIEDVMLMIPARDAKRFGGVINPKVNLCPFYFPRIRYPSNLIMLYSIFRKIKRFKPDIIHIQKGHPWFNLAIPLLRRYCLVTTIHDVILLDWPSQRIPLFTYTPPIKYANQLIVHGKKLKASMIKEYNVAPDNIHVLNRGTNSIYTRYPIDSEENAGPRVLYFGRIYEYKGLRYLIAAEPLINKAVPGTKIVIAGTGEDFNKYRELMVNKENFIVHNEYISDDKVGALFQQASLVVLPYTDGSQSGVIPQAYAFKKPVVITNVGSLPEAVEHGITGYIVPPKDSKKLAEAIIDLLQNDEKRKKMGENAYQKAQGKLCWDKIAAETVQVYKRALGV